MNKYVEKIYEIKECICDKIINQEITGSGGLFSGGFGELLFLYYFDRNFNDNKLDLLIEKYENSLLLKLDTQIFNHSYCEGLSGILCLFNHLSCNGFSHIDTNEVDYALNDYLERLLKKDFSLGNYDLLYGALGTGMYFLKKKKNAEIIENIISFLEKSAIKNESSNIYKWKVPFFYENTNQYNLSLSHGVAGIILFLTYLGDFDFLLNRVIKLVEGSINFILSQEYDLKIHGCFFPEVVTNNFTHKTYRSRLAWCYGDLGIGYAIWKAGNTFNNTKWITKGMEILLYTTKRRSLLKNFVLDAQLCHGSAGIALVFQRVFINTNCDDFKIATDYWAKQTLNLAVHSNGLAGYRSHQNKKWSNDYSLLSGVAGIGMFLISYITEDRQDWDELFLL